ncbi:MAG TPA: ferredoxin--NADP reductase [Alphaproteobacteria bacterium]|nr:ferredoxin--NADP reductase [Alphaproteobacteria bacterium]
MGKWVEGRVIARHHWTAELFSLRVDAPVETYQAGQFTRLALDIDGERVARPYSYVNAPHERPLEFYFITVPDGPLTSRMVELDEGDRIWVQSRAAGLFTLEWLPDGEDLWLLSTGTALGVFLAILKTEEPWNRYRRVVLVHGVRTGAELTYRDTIAELQDRHGEQFRTVSLVSREDHSGALRGRITHAIEDGRLEQAAGLQLGPETSQVMLCGNPDMVSDTTALLEARGMKRNRRKEPGHITTEKYWG